MLALTLIAALAGATPTPSSPGPASLPVRVVTSEVLSLLYFAQSAAGRPHTSTALRARFAEAASPEEQDALATFSEALGALPSGFGYWEGRRDLPPGRHHGQSFADLLEVRAAASKDLDDLGARILGLLPVSEHAELLRALRALSPLHRRVLWEPESARLEQDARRLRELVAAHDVERRLGAIAGFYRARWPEGLPFTMALVPVPKARVTQAHSVDAVEVVEVPPGDDLVGRLGVIVHEACHSLYEAQPLEVQHELFGAFATAAPGPLGDLVYQQLNEGLATAVGNGWLEGKVRGGLPPGEWYNDEVIDGVARDLYPEVAARLDGGGVLDDALVEDLVRRFVVRFPGADRSPALLLDSVLLMTDERLDARAVAMALRGGRTHSIYTSSPAGHAQTLETYLDGPKATPLLVVTPAGLDELGALPFARAVRARWTGVSVEGGAFAVLTEEGDGRRKLVVVVRDQAEAEAAVVALREHAPLDLEAAVVLAGPGS